MTEDEEREVLFTIRRLNDVLPALEKLAEDAETHKEVAANFRHRKWLRAEIKRISALLGALVAILFIFRDGITLAIDAIADQVSRRQ